MPTDEDTLIPLLQAARHLGITRAIAYSRVRQGTLHATLIKGNLMVSTAEIKRYRDEAIAHPLHRGRKPKKPTE